jgi:hypothetical protein
MTILARERSSVDLQQLGNSVERCRSAQHMLILKLQIVNIDRDLTSIDLNHI